MAVVFDILCNYDLRRVILANPYQVCPTSVEFPSGVRKLVFPACVEVFSK